MENIPTKNYVRHKDSLDVRIFHQDTIRLKKWANIFISLLFFRRKNTIKQIEFATGINVHNRDQDGVMIFHKNKLLKHKRSNSTCQNGIVCVIKISNVFDDIFYTEAEYLNSKEFLALEIYFLKTSSISGGN